MKLSATRVLELTEYQPLLLARTQLSEDEGETIWRRYGRQVAVEFPSLKTNGRWALTAQGYVGVLPVHEGLTLLLTPKTSIAKLWRMVEYALSMPLQAVTDEVTSLATVPELYQKLAQLLAEKILRRARRGIVHAYTPQSGRPAVVRGQLDLAATLRHPSLSTLSCRYEVHSADVAENQILLWTLDRILYSVICNEQVRATVKRAFSALAGQVTLKPWPTTALRDFVYNRLNRDYRPLHALCRFFLDQSSPALCPGDAQMIPFALDMALLYERFVAAWLTEHFDPRWRVVIQERHRLGAHAELLFTIDVVVRERPNARARWVLDTKYKTPVTAPSNADLAQVLAYAQTTGAPEAVLIYPTPLARPLDVRVGDVRVRSLTFDLARDLDEAGHELLRSLVTE